MAHIAVRESTGRAEEEREHLDEAERLAASGMLADADAVYGLYLDGPYALAARLGKGVVALMSGDGPSALGHFKHALAHAPDDARAHMGLGLARGMLGYARGARLSFGDCLERDPDNVGALAELVRVAFALKDHASAEGHVAAYVARHPDSADFRFTLAGLQLLSGRARAAERTLDELAARHPSYPDTGDVRARIEHVRRQSGEDDAAPRARGRFVVAVIPARGGSKGISRKNLRPLAGIPLIAHTINAAREARLVDVVAVTTDDAEIARAAREAGAEVVDRPAELATDEAPTEPALLHAVEVIERRHESTCDAVLLLQCTSPLRGAAAIDAAVTDLFESRCDSVVAVRADLGAHFTGSVRDGQFIPPYDPQRRRRRQELPALYRETGALYAATRTLLMGTGCRMGGQMRPLILSEEDATDIDTPSDFAMVERILELRRRQG